jgi:hypothetical protein
LGIKPEELNMKIWLLLIPFAVLIFFSLIAQEEPGDGDYQIEESPCENGQICRPAERRGYFRCYYCPHRYSDFYDYDDRDIDATWPGKIENSFMESLMR